MPSPTVIARRPHHAKRPDTIRTALASRQFSALAALAGIVVVLTSATAVSAQQGRSKPYDTELMRLSEILGAVHYLRELCGSEDGQLWRDQMNELITAEGSSALRRARLTRRFNQGYRSYSRTYNVCTASARTAIERFIAEGVNISESVLKRIP